MNTPAADAPTTAWIRLRGHDPLTAVADLSHRTRQTRLTRAILTLVGCWILAPIVFFVPPHLPWAAIALGSGVYLGFKQWRGEYVVESFAGECPRCRSPLTIAPGAKIRLPHKVDCYECHHEPFLEVAPARS